MKKRHYILLAIILIIVIFCLFLKMGEYSVIVEPVQSVMKMQMVNHMTGETNEITTVSLDDEKLEINRSNYKTESEYKHAIEDAKAELGFRKK